LIRKEYVKGADEEEKGGGNRIIGGARVKM